jgi:hypothetical protein
MTGNAICAVTSILQEEKNATAARKTRRNALQAQVNATSLFNNNDAHTLLATIKNKNIFQFFIFLK